MNSLTTLALKGILALVVLAACFLPATSFAAPVNCILTVDANNNWTGNGPLCPGAPFARSTFTKTIFEGIQYKLPGTIIPGDVVLCEDVFCTPSDILRFTFFFFRPSQAEEYCPPADGCTDPNDVLFPFRSLINPVFICETNSFCFNGEGTGIQATSYKACNIFGACNTYTIISDTPEPSGLTLLISGLLGLAGVLRWRHAIR